MKEKKIGSYIPFAHEPTREEVADSFMLMAAQASAAIRQEKNIAINENLSVMLFCKNKYLDELSTDDWMVGYLITCRKA